MIAEETLGEIVWEYLITNIFPDFSMQVFLHIYFVIALAFLNGLYLMLLPCGNIYKTMCSNKCSKLEYLTFALPLMILIIMLVYTPINLIVVTIVLYICIMYMTFSILNYLVEHDT